MGIYGDVVILNVSSLVNRYTVISVIDLNGAKGHLDAKATIGIDIRNSIKTICNPNVIA